MPYAPICNWRIMEKCLQVFADEGPGKEIKAHINGQVGVRSDLSWRES